MDVACRAQEGECGYREAISNVHHDLSLRFHIPSRRKLATDGYTLLLLEGFMESSICHSTFPDIILYLICLNVFLLRSYRLLSLGPRPYTRQIRRTFVKWHSQLELLAGSDNQSDRLCNCSSFPLLIRYCLPASQRVDILFPLMANFPFMAYFW